MPRRPRPVPAPDPGTRRFVSYLRVSTERQGRSGLGLEAQREAVTRHAAGTGGEVIGEYIEIETGKNNARPKLAQAMADCRAMHATLLVAKLDRLSRNLAFLAGLMEAEVDFICCDSPHATRFTLHILAAVAEHERRMISERTRSALAAAKARGVRLGNPNLQPGDARATAIASAARSKMARERAVELMTFIDGARSAGASSLQQVADALMRLGVRTPNGRTTWHPASVANVERRAGRQPAKARAA